MPLGRALAPGRKERVVRIATLGSEGDVAQRVFVGAVHRRGFGSLLKRSNALTICGGVPSKTWPLPCENKASPHNILNAESLALGSIRQTR